MTIYATPFNHSTKLCTGPSTDSGLKTLKDVVNIMGEPDVKNSVSLRIYGTGEQRVVFSRLIFFIDDAVNNG
jgi:hypothetical protein